MAVNRGWNFLHVVEYKRYETHVVALFLWDEWLSKQEIIQKLVASDLLFWNIMSCYEIIDTIATKDSRLRKLTIVDLNKGIKK